MFYENIETKNELLGVFHILMSYTASLTIIGGSEKQPDSSIHFRLMAQLSLNCLRACVSFLIVLGTFEHETS